MMTSDLPTSSCNSARPRSHVMSSARLSLLRWARSASQFHWPASPLLIGMIQFLINLLTTQRNLCLDSLGHLPPLTVGRLGTITCGRKNLFRQARGFPKEFVG